ncbi:(E)-4-hydroxy-3-methylbut-2-enyl-diphosphate synthase [Candidatus Margulisiibacteriota bacterium]
MNRIPTHEVTIGSLKLGGSNPIRIQSMTNTDTTNTTATVKQIIQLVKEGCELVRLAVPSIKAAKNIENIKKKLKEKNITIPLIADIHFNADIAQLCAKTCDKIRINPGTYLGKKPKKEYTEKEYENELDELYEKLKPLIHICKKEKTAIRIGINHASLPPRIINGYGATPAGMVVAALELVRLCEKLEFDQIVISLKASDVKTMIEANKLLIKELQEHGIVYPIHLGVTEAGGGQEAIIKSAIGIGSLLLEGIGDTIRVSLTGDPVKEIDVVKNILQSTGRRITKAEFVSCPTCGRTSFDVEKTLQKIKEMTKHLKGIKIAVMGCIVNGPGEMEGADYGYVGSGKNKIDLYKGETVVERNIPTTRAIEKLLTLINEETIT